MSDARSITTHQCASGARSGMVLLLTLVILALVSSWLTIMVSRSARIQLSAQSAQRELQSRWAQQSLQRVCLLHAKEILDTDTDSKSESAGSWLNVSIAQNDYQVCVSDEQSKYNIATRLGSGTLEEAASVLRGLVPDGRVNLAELRRAQLHQGSGAGLSTYDQLWLEIDPESIFGSQISPGYFQGITLWGDGRLNLEHATEAVCVQAMRGILTSSEARQLYREYRATPDANLDTILVSLDIPKDTKDKLSEQVVTESSCYSVVIRLDTEDTNPDWRFAVQWMIEDKNQGGQRPQPDGPRKRVRVQLW